MYKNYILTGLRFVFISVSIIGSFTLIIFYTILTRIRYKFNFCVYEMYSHVTANSYNN